jgi:hypothetical protein
MLAGSINTPSRPKVGASLMTFRLDAVPLGVASVAAHVPPATQAQHGTGSAYDTDDEISGDKPASGRRGFHPSKRFMAEDQPLFAGWHGVVLAGNELSVGPAYAERHDAYQDHAVRPVGFEDIL